MGKSTLRSVPSNHRTTRVFSVRESLRRRYAPDIQQFAASAQFKLWELKEWLRSHVRTVVVSAKSSSNCAGEQHLSGACPVAKTGGNVSRVTDHGDDSSTWRPERSHRNFAGMNAHADAGVDCELVPPSSRHRRKTPKHRATCGEGCAGARPGRISDPKSRHHAVTGHVEHLAAERHGDARKNGEELIEQGYYSYGLQSLGETGVSPHVGEQHRGMGHLRGNSRCVRSSFQPNYRPMPGNTQREFRWGDHGRASFRQRYAPKAVLLRSPHHFGGSTSASSSPLLAPHSGPITLSPPVKLGSAA